MFYPLNCISYMYEHKFNNNRIIFKPINGKYVCVNYDTPWTCGDFLDELLIMLDPNCSKASFEYHDHIGNLLYTVDFNSWRTTCIITLTINIYTRKKLLLPGFVASLPSHLINLKV